MIIEHLFFNFIYFDFKLSFSMLFTLLLVFYLIYDWSHRYNKVIDTIKLLIQKGY